MSGLSIFDLEGVRIIQPDSSVPRHGAGRNLESAIEAALGRADGDPAVRAIVIYGGCARALAVGENFDAVTAMTSGEQVDDWVNRAINLHLSVLRLKKPSVIAIDGVAAGMGFQFAMMFDRRLMSPSAALQVTGLGQGISCPLGATILAELTSWNTMREIVFEMRDLPAEAALQRGLINAIADADELLEEAVSCAALLASCPQHAFLHTKQIVNGMLMEKIASSAGMVRQVHRSALDAGGWRGARAAPKESIVHKFAAF